MHMVVKVSRGDWLFLPSGRTVQVCKIIGESHPEVSLRYLIDSAGEIRHESTKEKRFRVKWEKPIPVTPSSTQGDFVTMDHSLFPNWGRRA